MGLKSIFRVRKGSEEPEPVYEAPYDRDELLYEPNKRWQCTSSLLHGAIIVFAAVVLPVLLYITVFTENAQIQSAVWTCALKSSYRVACMKGAREADASACERNGCCWNETEKFCFHSVPSRHNYAVVNWTDSSQAAQLFLTNYLDLKPRLTRSPYGRNVANTLRALAVPVSESRIQIMLYDPSTGTPAPPERIPVNNSRFQVSMYGPDYFSFELSRSEDKGAVLLSTSTGPLISSENYWELSLKLPTDGRAFGFGELDLPPEPKLLYNNGSRLGVSPFIMVLDRTGRAHGILIESPGPMEVELLRGSNLLILRSLSTSNWNINVYAGPTPADVMEQYTSERRPSLPPSWALGLHICRDTNESSAPYDFGNFTEGAAVLGLPYESDCLHEKLLGGLDLTIPDSLRGSVEQLSKSNKKLLVSLQPQVVPALVNRTDLLVQDESGAQVLVDSYLGVNVSFLDVFHAGAAEWLQEKLQGLELGTVLGGFVLQEEWPAVNTSLRHTNELMDYVPGGSLSNGTLRWKVLHGNKEHYLIHNEYGLQFSKAVASGLGTDQVVLSGTTYTGSGSVGGSHAHNHSEVHGTWTNMLTALKVALGLGLAGIPLSGGGPVCGTTGDYEEELCLRWYQMSSMLPLMRVSSQKPLRDPVNLKSYHLDVTAAVRRRYALLSYFYSLFHEASTTGAPVVRPLFFEFPADNNTWTRDDHFMVGPALLVRPIFLPGQVSVQVYLPKPDTSWYQFYGGHRIDNGTAGYEVTVFSLLSETVVLLRGGYIVPTQYEEVDGFTLVVGLSCEVNGSCKASGDLQVNLNTSLTFSSSESVLQVGGVCGVMVPPLQEVVVYGLDIASDSSVQLEINPTACSTTQAFAQVEDNVLRIHNLTLDMCCGEPALVSWATK